MNWKPNIICMSACIMCRERELPSKTQHNENAVNWNASPIIAESEFPARKIFSWQIKWWRKKMKNKK